MPQVRVYVSIPRPVEEVFSFLADGCNLAAWHSGVMSVRPDGAEESYRYRFPGRRRECRLSRTVCEPPTRVGFVGQRMWTPLGTQVPRFDFRLWPWEGGSRVEVGVTSRLSGAMVLLWPVVACGWRRDLPVDAQQLYEVLCGVERPEEAEEAAVVAVRETAGGGPSAGAAPDASAGVSGAGTPAGAVRGAGGLGPDISTDPGFGPAEPCWRDPVRSRTPWPAARRFRLPVPRG
ncbi:SRPBCC family protein [Streptomyces megasporus]|uniref:SRPBCC family protein n=1 Tax=Streptomyces megasporus TaxID=44060 RepID=UPI0004E0FB37|nr:SRPBCC family protein [Streptomyces megasporus]